MSTDAQHGLALLAGIISLCGGTYLLAGAGAAMVTVGGLLLAAVIYARTRGDNDDARPTD